MPDSTRTENDRPNDLGEAAPRKPMRYYIDFENVRGAGLKGI